MSLRKFSLIDDIYYSKEYITLYLKQKEEIFEFKYEKDDKLFFNIAIKRPIEKILDNKLDELYYDLETVYGYGGFYTNTEDKEFLKEAFNSYEEKCKEENIIAEFFRFHPFNTFCTKFGNEFFDLNINDRETVYLNLLDSKEKRWDSYSSKTRNILRKCSKELTITQSDDIDKFISLYHKTMKRNNASSFYYFEKSYFENLIKHKNIKLYEVRKDDIVISSSFFIFSKDFAYYHLSANDYTMRNYNANYFILDEVFTIAKEKGCKYFFLGGGTTSAKDDTLLKFKQKFSQKTKSFYISGKVYNKEIYEKYVKLWETLSKKDMKYFLKYRLEIE